jgi:hypothetical protein
MIDKLLNEAQRAAIRQNYRGLVEGSDDELLVLEAGAKFEPLNMSPVDLQLMETRRFTVEDIARWFGISSVMINDTAKTTTWGTGIEQIIEGFYKFKLRPMLESLEQALERRVLSPRQRELYTVEFSLEAILRGSYKDRLDAGSKAVQNGLMTRNEWRQLENLPPLPGGEALTAQSNLVPVDQLGAITPGVPASVQESVERLDRMFETLQHKGYKEQSIQFALNPQIQVQTPEIKMDLSLKNDKPSVKKSIKLIRDERGNVVSAESTED